MVGWTLYAGVMWGTHLSPVYEAYIKQHPENLYHRSRYAAIAVWSGHPEVADQQLEAMGGKFSYAWFGTDAGFHYSEAVKNAAVTWDAASLDKWLTDPKADIPGTKMTFPGLKDAKDRTDVIAYLMVQTGYKP